MRIRDKYEVEAETMNDPRIGVFIETKSSGEAEVEAPPSLADPTVRFRPGAREDFPLDAEAHRSWLAKLERLRLLFLICPDPDVRYSAVVGLVRGLQSGSSTVEPRLLSFRQLPDAEPPELRKVLACEREWGERVLLVVEAHGEDGQPFLGDLVASLTEAESLLKENGVSLLVSTTATRLAQARGRSAAGSLVTYQVEIPFLEPRLRRVFPERARELADELEPRWKGRGDDVGEEAFCGQLNHLLENGKLVERITEGKLSIGDALDRVLETEKKRALELLKAAGPLEKALLFVAAFLPELTPEEFRGVLEDLAPDEASAAVAGEPSVLDLYASPQSSLAQWDRHYIELLRACRLRIVAAGSRAEGGLLRAVDEGARVVAFEPPTLGRQVAQAFLTDYYFDFLHLSDRALAPDWLLRDGKQLRQGLGELLVARARLDPARYGVGVLLPLVPLHPGEKSGDKPECLPDQRERCLRMVPVLRRMLRHEPLRQVANRFLNELLFNRQLELLIELLRRLGGSEGFEVGYWRRQLLERAPIDKRRKVTAAVTADLANPARRQEAVSDLLGWLEQGTPTQRSWRAAFFKLFGVRPMSARLLFLDEGRSAAARRVEAVFDALYHARMAPTLFKQEQVCTQYRLRGRAGLWIRHWLGVERGRLPQAWRSLPRQLVDEWRSALDVQSLRPVSGELSVKRVGGLFRSILLATWAVDLCGSHSAEAVPRRAGNVAWQRIVSGLKQLRSPGERQELLADWRFLVVATSKACDVALGSGHEFLRDKHAPRLHSKARLLSSILNDLAAGERKP